MYSKNNFKAQNKKMVLQTDLFLSKETQLAQWMKQKHYFATHDVMRWGVENFYDRADRTKRDFLEQNLIRKLDDKEKIFRGFTCKDAVYGWRENTT